MSADIMRRYLDLVESRTHEIDVLFATGILTETRTLTEGAVTDRIKAAMAKVSQRFGKATPQVMDQVADRAESLFQRDAEISWVIDRAKALSRSPALLAAMVGICGALISLSPNPAAAQDAADKLKPILSMQDVNQIVDLLAQHGVLIKSDAGASKALPTGLSPIMAKAVRALKAINDYQFVEGGQLESDRELQNEISMVGGIKKEGARYAETVSLWTSDHRLLIAEFSSVFEVRNGSTVFVEENMSGLRSELIRALTGLPENVQDQISNYIQQNGGLDESAGLNSIDGIVKTKGQDLCAFVARLAVRKTGVASRVEFGPRGIRVA